MQDLNLNIKKEDTELQKETLQEITRLQGLISNVESKQDESKEYFKRSLDKMIPELDDSINELFAVSQDQKFLNGDNIEKMEEMLIELNEIEQKFNSHEETANKYNKWQEVLETQ